MEVIEGPILQFWGYANSVTLDQDSIFNCQLIMVTPKVMCYSGTDLKFSGHPFKVNLYNVE